MGTVTNTIASGSLTTSVGANPLAATATLGVNGADLSLAKVISGPAVQGATVSYTVTLVNLGPGIAQNVTITDVMSAGLVLINASSNQATTTVAGSSASAVTASLAIGQTLTLIVIASVSASTGSITNTAFGTSTTADGISANNTVTVVTAVDISANLTLTKVSNGPAVQGSTISYTVTVVNLGPSTAQNVSIADVLSTGLSFISASTNGNVATSNAGANTTAGTTSLALGQTLTLVVNAAVTAASGSVTNTAGVSATTVDPSPNNTVTVATPVTTSADLAISISAPASGTPGQTLTAVVTITNNGPSTASNVTATIVLPNGVTQTITVTSLILGGTSTTSIAYSVPAGSTTVQTFSGAVTSTTADTSPGNNTASASIGINLTADVTTRVTVPADVSVSVVISGTVSFANIGGTQALNVGGTVTLPTGVVAKTIPAGASTATVAGLQVIIFPPGMSGLGTVNPGTTTSFTFTFKTPVVTGTYSITSTVVTTSEEAVTPNNSSVALMTLGTPLTNASLSGRVYLDVVRNKVFDVGSDKPLANFRVEVVRFVGTTTIVYGSALTNDKGEYLIKDLPVGGGFNVRFFDNGGTIIFSTPFNSSPLRSGQQVSLLGNPSTGTNTMTGPVTVNRATPFSASIDDVTLYSEDNVTEQNLPLDPGGVVYNSITREPVKGATVKLIFEGNAPFNPALQILSGSNTAVTGENGLFQFWFINNPPSGVYRFEVIQPAGFVPPEAIQGGVISALPLLNARSSGDVKVQPQGTAPAVGVNGGSAFVGLNGPVGTQYFLRLDLNLPAGVQVLNNHIPLDPLFVPGALLVSKTGDKTVAEVGDSVQYTIRIRNTTIGSITSIKLSDLLPAGFRYILGTARMGGVAVSNPAGGIGRELTFDIGTIAAQATTELTYFVRLGVGSQQGDGINRAQVVAPVLSNVALFKVTVQGGVFSNEGCITGKVYVDCDGNAVQNNSGGSREMGIPGVRLIMLDGTFILTDAEGKYSICGVKPQTHVIKVDRTTLPKGSRMVPSSNRNAGVGDSLFVDIKGGELARADFIEGSCSPEVLDQVKARRASGGVLSPESEKKLPLKIENRPAEAMQEILPVTRQQNVTPGKPGDAR